MARSLFLSVLLAVTAPLLASSTGTAPEGGWDPDFSIGLKTPLSSDGHVIPSFFLVGQPNYPQVLSDRIVLTPPSPGHQRSGVWTEHTNPYNEWTVDIDFRATGPDRGKGSFTFWYTARGRHGVSGIDSIYTTKPYDGLALVIDNSAGGQTQLRAYLNDGGTDYSIHHDVHGLAFAHCDVYYRNRGAPTNIKITHSFKSIRVEADGNLCFETADVRLPLGYFFGATAASGDLPDNIELFHFKISSPERTHHHQEHYYHDDPAAWEKMDKGTYDSEEEKRRFLEEKKRHREAYGHRVPEHDRSPPVNEHDYSHGIPPHERVYKEFVPEPDVDPSKFKTQDQQFRELHDRLQALTHHLAAVQHQIGAVYDRVDSIVHRLEDQHNEHRGTRVPRDQVDRLEDKLSRIEEALAGKDYSKQFESLQTVLREQHHSLLYATNDSVQKAITKKTHRGLYVLMVVQVGMVGYYVYQKRKKSTIPKKYV